MTRYLVVFAGALVLSLLGTPLARRLGLRLQVMDQPDAQRKVHSTPTPRLGGVAIFLSAMLVMLMLGDTLNLNQLGSILIGATGVSVLGLWDDRRSIPAWGKLLGQCLAAGLLIATGVRVSAFPWPGLNLLVSLMWIVGITNALNLLDNMDGLSGGVAAVAAGFFLLIAALNGQYLVSAMAAALLGACLGFLRYNFNPASIFMGDAGSLFLGFILAALGIKLRFPSPPFPANADLITWMIPVLVLGIPIFDTTLVTVSRLRRGLNPLTHPGKDHLSHRLVARGMSRREAVLAIYVLAFALGMAAILVSAVVLRAGPVGAISWGEIVAGYGIGATVLLLGLWALVQLERGWSP